MTTLFKYFWSALFLAPYFTFLAWVFLLLCSPISLLHISLHMMELTPKSQTDTIIMQNSSEIEEWMYWAERDDL